MPEFEQQLSRYLEMFIYQFYKHRDLQLPILTLEHFLKQGRPLDEQTFRLVDRTFVRTGVLDTEPFWRSKSYDD